MLVALKLNFKYSSQNGFPRNYSDIKTRIPLISDKLKFEFEFERGHFVEGIFNGECFKNNFFLDERNQANFCNLEKMVDANESIFVVICSP